MRISIFGLGYVGCVSAGCLAEKGHYVVGIDVDPLKIDLINSGKPTIVEKDIDKIIEQNRSTGKLEATRDVNYAIENTDISIICVGTPINDAGHLDLRYIYKVSEEIGESLKNKDKPHIIVVRSTVKPGTNYEISSIIEKTSGKIRNKDFAIISNPEFLREGSAVFDYYNPPYTLLGSDNEMALGIMQDLYKDINAPIYKTDIFVAEIIKYINNSFHALKITFANEVGSICKTLNIDSHSVMDLVCKDHKLNISPYYLKPGAAYGGSCLPKDLKALVSISKDINLEIPVLQNIEKSNEIHKDRVLKEILKTGKKRVGILGLSFKAGTDDLRESPMVDLTERLIGKGFDLKIYDKNIQLSKLIGKNKSYIETKLPHISKLLTDLKETVAESEILVIANKEVQYKELLKMSTVPESKSSIGTLTRTELDGKLIIDLVRITDEPLSEENYNGICW